MGFRIFVHAISLVVGHLADALRIGAVPYAIQLAALLILGWFAPINRTLSTGFDPAGLAVSLAIVVISLITNFWIAVAWHRYVLLDEMPSAYIAPFNGRRVLAYFGKSLQLFLVALGIAILVTILAVTVSALSKTTPSSATASLLVQVAPLVMFAIIAIIFYRVALILPASAIDKPIGFREAWSATAGATGTIILLSVLSLICVLALHLPAVLLRGSNGPLVWLAPVWQVLVSWIEVMVGVSILTTLYGYYVERRPIA